MSKTTSHRLMAESALLTLQGVGLHTGRRFLLSLHSAPSVQQPQFKVIAHGSEFTAPALWSRLSGTTRSTALVLRGSEGKVELRTVEHLMAALYLLGLQKIEIRVESLDPMSPDEDVFEVPVLDGSSVEWTKWLWPLADQKKFAANDFQIYRIHQKIEVSDNDRRVTFEPLESRATRLELFVDVDFGRQLQQSVTFVHDWLKPSESQKIFLNNFAPARTFGFKHELEALAAKGLAKGATMSNALLIDGQNVANIGGFRVPSELAAHKLVDALGDLALAGLPMVGRVRCSKAGHFLHVKALKEAFAQELLKEESLHKS